MRGPAVRKYRASDHSPTLVKLSLETAATAVVSEPRPFRGDWVTGTVTLTPRVPVLLGAGQQPVLLTSAAGETASTTITLRTVWQELVDRSLQVFG